MGRIPRVFSSECSWFASVDTANCARRFQNESTARIWDGERISRRDLLQFKLGIHYVEFCLYKYVDQIKEKTISRNLCIGMAILSILADELNTSQRIAILRCNLRELANNTCIDSTNGATFCLSFLQKFKDQLCRLSPEPARTTWFLRLLVNTVYCNVVVA